MIAAVKGFVSKIEMFKGREGAADQEMVHVACGEYIMRVRCPDDASYSEMDEVVVSGELAVFEKRPYIKAGSIRPYRADDAILFRRDIVETGMVASAMGAGGPAADSVAGAGSVGTKQEAAKK